MTDFPVVTVEVAFVSEPLDTTPTFTDVTSYVRSVSTRCGRSEQFSAYDPGVATVVLDNTTREFDPLHSGGPHASDLLPNKKIRVKATWDGDEYELFTGHVDGWPQSYDSDGESFTTVVAPDAFKLLGRRRLPDYYAQVIEAATPRLWYRFDSEGTKLIDASGNGRDAVTSIPTESVQADGIRSFPSKAIDLASTWDAKIPSEHLAFDYDPFSIEFWFQASSPPSTYLAPIATIGTLGLAPDLVIYDSTTAPTAAGAVQFGIIDNRASGVGSRATSTTRSLTDGVPHHVVCTRNGSTFCIYIDGVLRSSGLGSIGSIVTTVGATLDLNAQYFDTFDKWEGASSPQLGDFAIYDVELSAADALAHYEAGAHLWDGQRTGERAADVLDLVNWPSALYDVDTGQSYLGPAVWDDNTTALDYLRLLEATEQGALYCDHANGGVVRFRSRTDFLTNVRSTSNQGVYSDNDGDAGFVIRYSNLELAYEDSDIVNRVDVEWVGGTVTALDQTSIDTYEEQSRTITTLMPTKADAESLASWVLHHYKDAFVRVKSITINPSAQTGASAELAWEGCLKREIGDRILVVRHPRGIGTEFSQAVVIEGIEHTIEDGQSWSTTFRCGPAELNEYWILGTSELGSETRLSF